MSAVIVTLAVVVSPGWWWALLIPVGLAVWATLEMRWTR